MSAITGRVVLTLEESATVLQAIGQAVELDRVAIGELGDDAGLPASETARWTLLLEAWLAACTAVMAKITRAREAAGGSAGADVVLDLTRAEARTIVRAVLASVDFDDQRIAGIYTHGLAATSRSGALRAYDSLVDRNAGRRASLVKLYRAAGIEVLDMPDEQG
jgi:hypothetical protein